MDVKHVRFLTPYKVAITWICMVYLRNAIDVVSRVDVMMEILEFLDGGSDQEYEKEHEKQSQDKGSKLMNLVDGDIPQLKQMLAGAKCTDGSLMYDALRDMLCHGIASLNHLHVFISSINNYLLTPIQGIPINNTDPFIKVGSESVLGVFLRRVYLEFDRMTFDQVVDFWQVFCDFRDYFVHVEKSVSDKRPLFEEEQSHLGDLAALKIDDLFPSNRRVRVKLVAEENLNNLLQQQCTNFEKFGDNVSPSVLSLLSEISNAQVKHGQHGSLPPAAYFVRYLDSCRSRDFQQALENLHHFYDYSLDDKTGKSQYHYALFSLAIMSAEFDNSEEALKAAEEAVAIGRHKGDHHFLTEILSWLYSYLDRHPHVKVPESLASKEQMIQYLKSRSWETSTALSSLAFQSDALRLMGKGDRSLSAVFENLVKSYYMNLESGDCTLGANCNLVLSALWSRSGVYLLSEYCLDICKDISMENPNSHVYLQYCIRKARLRALRGGYKQEIDNFEALEPKFANNIAHRQLWLWHLCVMKLNASINERRLNDARMLLQFFERVDKILPLDVHFDVKLAEIKYYLLTDNVPKATEIALSHSSLVVDLDYDIFYHLKFNILYIRGLIQSVDDARTLTLLLNAYSVAERVSLVPICLEVLVLLAKISSIKGHHRDAITIVDKLMPRLLETEDAAVIAEAYETMADATIGLVQSRTQKEDLCQRAFAFLGQAGDFYQHIGDISKGLEVCLKQLTICELAMFGHQKQKLEDAKAAYCKMLGENKAASIVTIPA